MKLLDLLLLIPLLWGAVNGYRKGLLIEIVGVVAFVVAMIVGFKFLGLAVATITEWAHPAPDRGNVPVSLHCSHCARRHHQSR